MSMQARSTLLTLVLSSGLGFAQTPPRYLTYATHLGGSSSDSAFGVAVDAAGNIFLAGYTGSTDFLAATGWDGIELQGGLDAVVVKLDPAGTEVIAVATLGGRGRDAARGVRVTPDGSVYIYGEVTPGFVPPLDACGAQVRGPKDVFAARLSNDLELETLHLLGGSGDDGPRGFHVSDDGVVSVVGYTTSTDLETTPGALQPRHQGGGTDFFVSRLRLADGLDCAARVSYLTYLGSRGQEADPSLDSSPFPGAITADAAGRVTVTGTTYDSGSFPSRSCSYRSISLGDADCFVVQLDPLLADSDQLAYGAIIGGSARDATNSVELTSTGRIRISGSTYSSDFPLSTPPATRGGNDALICELDPRCDAIAPAAQLTHSTAFGGASADTPIALLSLPDGAFLVGGIALSANFPATPDALGSFTGLGQAFLSVAPGPDHEPISGPVRFSTPLTVGACFDSWLECDRVLELSFLPDGTVLACGVTSSRLLSVTDGALQPSPAGGADMFLCRLDLRSPSARIAAEPSSGTAPLEVCFDAAGSTTPDGTEIEAYSWDLGDETRRTEARECRQYLTAGLPTARLEVWNSLDLVGIAEKTISVGCPRDELSPWIQVDVGDVSFSGGAVSDGCLAVCARGKTFSARADAMFFLHQPVAGDQRLTVRVTSLPAGVAGAAAGFMVRESLEPDARYAGILVEPNGRVRARQRLTAGSLPGSVLGPDLDFPIELRLDREGDTFVSLAREASGDPPGDWMEVGRAPIEGFAADALAGFAANAPVEICTLELESTSAPGFLRADSNTDGRVDVSDAIFTLAWLFLGGFDPGCLAAADANGDGVVDISDPTYTLSHLFLGGPAPPAPFPGCGSGGLTADEALGCVDASGSCP